MLLQSFKIKLFHFILSYVFSSIITHWVLGTAKDKFKNCISEELLGAHGMFYTVKESLTGLRWKDVHPAGLHEIPTQMGTGERIGTLPILRQDAMELTLW